ncbi:hypothetical protein BpHYR1_044291 [Brachionus plicatilis]|uniref:Uncharacterized protein n=1 Tax=Brachionus plicatilis TaxID=10195 RepID=A0A3M7PEC4_BRAPC|nr:hypothetical protein BpHYR1_044291 [Brachionus plicatilis]
MLGTLIDDVFRKNSPKIVLCAIISSPIGQQRTGMHSTWQPEILQIPTYLKIELISFSSFCKAKNSFVPFAYSIRALIPTDNISLIIIYCMIFLIKINFWRFKTKERN